MKDNPFVLRSEKITEYVKASLKSDFELTTDNDAVERLMAIANSPHELVGVGFMIIFRKERFGLI